jgi:RNA polymerase sigma-32 factor
MEQRLSGGDVSLDAPMGRSDEGERQPRVDFVTAGGASPERKVGDDQLHRLLREKLEIFGKTLKGRDKEIFELRITADEPQTLQEFGDRYGITRERARQIEARIINRLRDYLKQEIGDSVNIALDHYNE